MKNRILSLLKKYESNILEADENIKLLLEKPNLIPEHTDINKDIDKWVSKKSDNLSKFNTLSVYLPKEKDGK